LRRIHKFILAAFVVGLIEVSATTPAFSYVSGGTPWPGSPIQITYSYVNVFDGSLLMPDNSPLPNSIIKGSIEEALHLWTTAVPINFVEVPDSSSSQLRFRHVFINGPDPPPPGDPIAKAQSTCIGFSPAGCEVQYDDSDRWQVVGTQPLPDILGASVHEIGHVLGLNHTDVVQANMYWIFQRYSGLGTAKLFPDDIAGMQSIYGAGVGSLTTLAVPEPAAVMMILFGGAWFPTNRRARSKRAAA
jgi:hypothetical protein